MERAEWEERKQDAKSDFTHLIILFKGLLSLTSSHIGGLCRFLSLVQTVV